MKARRKNLRKRLAWALALACLLPPALALSLRAWTDAAYGGRIRRAAADVPAEEGRRVAVVFGAGLWRGGGPSPVLYDRVAAAAELYHAGRVRTLLLTGDNRFKNYNEPSVMRRTALELGVPDEALVLDFAGRSTYESCFRAREIFGLSRAVLVTQEFHLDRALYLCDSLGVEGIGLAADRRRYPRAARLRWQLREIPATAAAWLDLHVSRPSPVLGEKIPIEAAGDAAAP